jgi:hypothetical protein
MAMPSGFFVDDGVIGGERGERVRGEVVDRAPRSS